MTEAEALEALAFHTSRHSDYESPRWANGFLGHRDIRSTVIYARVWPEELRAEILRARSRLGLEKGAK